MSADPLPERYRRFVLGDNFVSSGLRFVVRRGVKSSNDLVLEVLTPDGWQPVKFETLFLLADFLFDNEEELYPRAYGNKGWVKVRDALKYTWEHGWVAAARYLDSEKRERERRLF